MKNRTDSASGLNRFTLHFSDQREMKFRSYYFEKTRLTTRVAFLLLTLLYGVFGYLDTFWARDYLLQFLIIRLAIVLPLFVMVIGLSFTKSFRKYWQTLLFINYLVAAIGIIIMVVLLPQSSFYSNGMMLVFLAGSVFIGLRFALASVAGFITLILYNLISLNMPEMSLAVMMTNNFFFVGALLIGMFASYYNEIFNRQNFDLYLQIAKKQQEIESANANLEKKVEQRTILLDSQNQELYAEVERRIQVEEELIKAKEDAIQSEKLKSAFLANMSHEIRTPMNGIIGFADLLNEAEDENELNEFIEIIKKNGEHLLNLINDIIDLSKIESGILKIHNQSFNLNQLTKEVYDLFVYDQHMVEAGIALTYENGLSNEQCHIITDRTRIKQIVINLVGNACKYTDEGSIHFGYTFINNTLHFFVHDTGIGIDEKQQEHVFERFMQVTLDNIPKRESTGLGLAISKTYLKMMGGDIKVKSQLGKGSEFSFKLTVEFDDEKNQIQE